MQDLGNQQYHDLDGISMRQINVETATLGTKLAMFAPIFNLQLGFHHIAQGRAFRSP